MPSDLPIYRFFGDAERAFMLTPTLIRELERLTDTGIGLLAHRVIGMSYKHDELTQILRLAMIGGGEQPQVAQRLVDVYTACSPVNHYYGIVVDIIQMTMFGPSDEPAPDTEPAPGLEPVQ